MALAMTTRASLHWSGVRGRGAGPGQGEGEAVVLGADVADLPANLLPGGLGQGLQGLAGPVAPVLFEEVGAAELPRQARQPVGSLEFVGSHPEHGASGLAGRAPGQASPTAEHVVEIVLPVAVFPAGEQGVGGGGLRLHVLLVLGQGHDGGRSRAGRPAGPLAAEDAAHFGEGLQRGAEGFGEVADVAQADGADGLSGPSPVPDRRAAQAGVVQIQPVLAIVVDVSFRRAPGWRPGPPPRVRRRRAALRGATGPGGRPRALPWPPPGRSRVRTGTGRGR